MSLRLHEYLFGCWNKEGIKAGIFYLFLRVSLYPFIPLSFYPFIPSQKGYGQILYSVQGMPAFCKECLDFFFLQKKIKDVGTKQKGIRIPSFAQQEQILYPREYPFTCKGRDTTWYPLFCEGCAFFFASIYFCAARKRYRQKKGYKGYIVSCQYLACFLRSKKGYKQQGVPYILRTLYFLPHNLKGCIFLGYGDFSFLKKLVTMGYKILYTPLTPYSVPRTLYPIPLTLYHEGVPDTPRTPCCCLLCTNIFRF